MDFLQNLTAVLTEQVGQILPGILGAVVVLLVGLILAAGIKRLVLLLFRRTKLDERVSKKMDGAFKIDEFIAKLAYYLVVVFVLLIVLNMMGIQGVLDPLSNMLDKFLAFLPNLVAAGVIGFAGYVIARIASEAVGFAADRLQDFSAKAGLKGSLDLAKLIKQITFVAVFIPVLIAAIDALKIEAVSKPATDMFHQFLDAVPQIISAAVILAVFYVVGRYITQLLSRLLAGLGTDQLTSELGLNTVIGQERSLSALLGNIAFFFILFSGIIAASEKLNLAQLTDILNEVFSIAGRVFFGLVILTIGNFLANLAKEAMVSSEDNLWLGTIVRLAVLFIFLALGLSTMGIAQEIVNLAFGLTIGALAVAFALAFGLGGREAAGQYLSDLLKRFRRQQ
ncbi:MAG: mechanosensitive ion channel [Bacteroidetes bacterium]|jgi:hypothetical protein|nr:mechanosensitive ion channel [Bacteroidota bacterium]